MFLGLYILALTALAVHAPASLWSPGTGAFIFVLGWIGVWRWSWGALHLCRSLWYRRRVFPRWRAQAEALAEPETAGELLASEVFIVVTSYRIPAETTLAAFTAAIEEAARYPKPGDDRGRRGRDGRPAAGQGPVPAAGAAGARAADPGARQTDGQA